MGIILRREKERERVVEREREGGKRERELYNSLYFCIHVHVGGYSAMGWNHPGFGDSSVSVTLLMFVLLCTPTHTQL